MMQIFVRLPKEKTITLNVEATYTVYAVKAIIQMKEGVPLFEQRLVHAGRPLHDGETLRNYNIQNNVTFEMSLRLRGGRGGMWDPHQGQGQWQHARGGGGGGGGGVSRQSSKQTHN